MAIKSIIALGLAGLLGCSSQEEEKLDYSTLPITNTYEIENSGCANVPNIGLVCYRGINENILVAGETRSFYVSLDIIAGETKRLDFKLSPAVQPLLDNEERTATFTVNYASNSRIEMIITQKKKEKKKE
ncbi:MAG: hypothetical protein V1734_04650 [Nanoarchaeota archaeon]